MRRHGTPDPASQANALRLRLRDERRRNIGAELRDGEDALLLEDGTSLEIASRIEQLLDDPSLVRRLGLGARRFALANLSWKDNAAALASFYRGLLAAQPVGAGAL